MAKPGDKFRAINNSLFEKKANTTLDSVGAILVRDNDKISTQNHKTRPPYYFQIGFDFGTSVFL